VGVVSLGNWRRYHVSLLSIGVSGDTPYGRRVRMRVALTVGEGRLYYERSIALRMLLIRVSVGRT